MSDKAKVQYILAAILLVSGIVLCYLSFYRTPAGTITASVLQYFAECLIWAASVFGCTAYVDFRIHKLKMPSKDVHRQNHETDA